MLLPGSAGRVDTASQPCSAMWVSGSRGWRSRGLTVADLPGIGDDLSALSAPYPVRGRAASAPPAGRGSAARADVAVASGGRAIGRGDISPKLGRRENFDLRAPRQDPEADLDGARHAAPPDERSVGLGLDALARVPRRL